MKKVYKIGLTGGIGSGKTTIAKILHSLGVPIFNSDDRAKEILQNNKDVIKQVKQKFGEKIVQNKKINRKELGKIVFQNKKKLKILNNIIHPIVIKDFENWSKKQTSHYIIKESALLFESKTHHNLDKLVIVKAKKKIRINRVMKRDQRSKKEVLQIINNQLKSKEIKQDIHYTINNNERQLLTPLVIKLHQNLMKL